MASPPSIRVRSTPAVTVDRAVCRDVARLLSRHDIPVDREDLTLPGLTRPQIGNFYLWLVAICHQTSPIGLLPLEGIVDGKRLRGWDYLSARFQEAAVSDPSLLVPAAWEATSGNDLAALFRDPVVGERLSVPDSRAALIRDIGKVMVANGWNFFEDLYAISKQRIASGHPSLLDLMAKFRAYDDPVHKKSYFLLALMRNTGLWEYVDNENLGPPVDYHEVRGHLRIGTVTVNDMALRDKLLSGKEVSFDEDIAIRQAVHDAIMLISELTGLRNPSRLHYLFWNVFRSCCTRESPHCLGCPTDCSLPGRYVPFAIQPDGQRRCPFASVCKSAGREPKFLEHVFSTDYY
jgi:hypothetical protein